MYKKIFLFLIAGTLVFGISKLSFAMICGEHSGSQQLAQVHSEHEHGTTEVAKDTATKESVNVGNKICPVSGEKIDEKTKATYEYKGKIYNFCCVSCVEDFKKDPQKYVKKIEEEKLQGKSKQEEDPSSESHQHSH